MIADNVRQLDRSGACHARPVAAARTLDDLIGQIRDIMRADDPAGEEDESAVQASVE
jgi:hypothetical protein